MPSFDLKVRLPGDPHRWVAEEALRSSYSMNAVVVAAIETLRTARSDQLADHRHKAAIETAISLGWLPKGTEIILTPDKNDRRTEVMIRKPAETHFSVLAHVHGEDVVFAGNPRATGRGEAQ